MSTNNSTDDPIPKVGVVAYQAPSVTDVPQVCASLPYQDEDYATILPSMSNGSTTLQSIQEKAQPDESQGSHPESIQPVNNKADSSRDDQDNKDQFSDSESDGSFFTANSEPAPQWEGEECESPDSYCPICLKTGPLFLCQSCKDMSYCSKICQKKDWPIHKALCGQLQAFAATSPPSRWHYRAILFPANKADRAAPVPTPSFVWISRRAGATDHLFPPDAERAVHCDPGMGTKQKGIATQPVYIHFVSYRVDPKLLQRNRCLDNTIGAKALASCWMGNVVIVGDRDDVTMRDFRVAVDFLQTNAWNYALVDPTRHFDTAARRHVGVIAIPVSHLDKPEVELKVRQVGILDSSKYYPIPFLHRRCRCLLHDDSGFPSGASLSNPLLVLYQ